MCTGIQEYLLPPLTSVESVSVDARATRNVPFSARLQGISAVEAGPEVEAADPNTVMSGVVHANKSEGDGKRAACRLIATSGTLRAGRQKREDTPCGGRRIRARGLRGSFLTPSATLTRLIRPSREPVFPRRFNWRARRCHPIAIDE